VTETKCQAILAVIAEGRTVAEVAAQWRVDRRTVHRWLARYETEGLEGLAERAPAGALPAPDAGGGGGDGARVASRSRQLASPDGVSGRGR
jgi:transposase-like protein